jgi:hypothetical protein
VFGVFEEKREQVFGGFQSLTWKSNAARNDDNDEDDFVALLCCRPSCFIGNTLKQ